MQNNVLIVLAISTSILGVLLTFTSYGEWSIMAYCAAAVLFGAGLCRISLRVGIGTNALIAALANGYLLWTKVFPAEGASLCTINTVVDCKAINNSPYSELFYGTEYAIPITLLGLAYFAGLALTSALADGKTPEFFKGTAWFSLANVLFTIYLLTALITERKFCVFCVTIYLSNLVILIAAFRGLRASNSSLTANVGSLLFSKPMQTLTTAFAIIVIGGYVGIQSENAPEVTKSTPVDKIDSNRLTALFAPLNAVPEMDGTEPIYGLDDAEYTLLEYADYGCPHCAQASAEIKHSLKDREDIRVKFKVFPLTGACNPSIDRSDQERLGPCLAAAAAECGHQAGAFWEVNSDLFSNQRALSETQWNVNDLEFIATDNGMDGAQFRACLQNKATMEGVLSDARSGARLGIQATPTFLLHGVLGDAWVRLKEPRMEHVLTLVNAHQKGVDLNSGAKAN